MKRCTKWVTTRGTKMTKLKDACMALLAMLLIILFPNMGDV